MPETPAAYRMSLGEHLQELRKRLILGLIGPVVAALVVFYFSRPLVAFLSLPFLEAMQARGLNPQMHFLNPISGVMVALKVSIIGGLIIGLPWLAWQMWRFIATGLYPAERRLVYLVIPGSAVLATAGVAFLYYVILPLMLRFLVGFALDYPMPELTPPPPTPGIEAPAEDDAASLFRLPVLAADPVEPVEGQAWVKAPENRLRVFVGGQVLEFDAVRRSMATLTPRLDEYLDFVLWMGLVFALAFQLPLVMVVLAGAGVIHPSQMRRARPYAVLGCFVVAMLVTPADVISQPALALPLWALYELGLALSRVAYRRRPGAAS